MKKVTFIFLLALGLVACKKDTPPPVVHPKPQAVAEYYFKGDIDGSPVKWEELPTNSIQAGIGSNSELNGSGDGPASLMASIYDIDNHMPGMGVTFQTYGVEGSELESNYFNNFITAGSNWNYATDHQISTADIGTKEIVVHYTDASGEHYSSTGAQSGSQLTVTSVTKIPADGFNSEALKIKLKFNCTVYPDNTPVAPINITNAEAVLYLGNMF